VRYTDIDQIKDLRIKLEDIFHNKTVEETAVSYSLQVRRPPMTVLQEAVDVFEEAKRRAGMNIDGLTVSGGGDAAFYTEKGVPAIDGLGIVGKGIHSPDEMAFLETFENRVKLALTLLEILEEWK
jgi:glutamate carboxypeptidase